MEWENSTRTESEKVTKDCENNQIGGNGDNNQKTERESADISTEGT